MKKCFVLAVFIVMFLAACGDDVTKVTNITQETSGLEVVASADSLGKCTAERSGEMKFAQKENAVYVCADSAWKKASTEGKDGSDGKDGTSCTVELLVDSSGYKVVCGGDSVGVIFNGEKGSAGKDGETCSFADNGDGTILQICGRDSVTLYKALCGNSLLTRRKVFVWRIRRFRFAAERFTTCRRIFALRILSMIFAVVCVTLLIRSFVTTKDKLNSAEKNHTIPMKISALMILPMRFVTGVNSIRRKKFVTMKDFTVFSRTCATTKFIVWFK